MVELRHHNINEKLYERIAMQPQFRVPRTEAEFKTICDSMTLIGAQQVLKARKNQRALAIKPFDDEIDFLNKVIDTKKAAL